MKKNEMANNKVSADEVIKDEKVKSESMTSKTTNKKNLFKDKKFLKVFIPVVIISVIAIVVLVSKLTDKGTKIQVTDVVKDNVKQYYDTTGTLEAGVQDKFYIYDGVMVTDVKVKMGSEVKAGDVLATFDTSSMNAIISEKKSAYTAAQKTYNDAVDSQKDAAASAAKIDEQIATLQAQKASGNFDTVAEGNANGAVGDAISGALSGALGTNENAVDPSAAIDAQIQLLQSEKQMYQNGQGENITKAYKTAMEAAKDEYDKAVAEKKDMDKGWIATSDGKISEISITAGKAYKYKSETSDQNDIMSALAGALAGGESISADSIVQGLSLANGNGGGSSKGVGLVVDSYGGYKVTFSLGKYDVQTVKVDMPAIVSYTDFKYDGMVTFIDAVANNTQTGLSSIIGGATGGSSSSSGGVKAEVTIKNPDSNLVLGFDAKLSILTNEVNNAVVIPIESLVIEDGNKYVYIYDKDAKVAKKTKVDIGISSDKFYEVKSGLKTGQKVIVNASKVTDGVKVYVGEKS